MSRNVMHANLVITKAIYGVLTEDDTQKRIAGLAQEKSVNDQPSLLVDQIVDGLLE